MKYAAIMDLYTDFLTSSPNIVSATLFSEVLNKSYSHDSITRMLAQAELDQKTYWKHVKSSIRQLESPNGVLSVDDTIGYLVFQGGKYQIYRPRIEKTGRLCAQKQSNDFV